MPIHKQLRRLHGATLSDTATATAAAAAVSVGEKSALLQLADQEGVADNVAVNVAVAVAVEPPLAAAAVVENSSVISDDSGRGGCKPAYQIGTAVKKVRRVVLKNTRAQVSIAKCWYTLYLFRSFRTTRENSPLTSITSLSASFPSLSTAAAGSTVASFPSIPSATT
jgi:hypothetical protein